MQSTLEVDYELTKVNPREYRVVKYLGGFEEQVYKVTSKVRWSCSCISGHIRGYCKHQSWVMWAERGKRLPEQVKLVELVTPDFTQLIGNKRATKQDKKHYIGKK